jgi:hypothetical protein
MISSAVVALALFGGLTFGQTYDFSRFPAADQPPPINRAWSEAYGVDKVLSFSCS